MSQVFAVRRVEPLKDANMIKSCYPTFGKNDRDHDLQKLGVADRWVRINGEVVVNCFALGLFNTPTLCAASGRGAL